MLSFQTQLKFIQLAKNANLNRYLEVIETNSGYLGFGLKNVNPTMEVLNYFTDCIPQVAKINDNVYIHPTLGVDKIMLEHLKREL